MMQDINWFSELFLSTDIWGWFGPLGLVVVTYMILLDKKLKPLGVIFLIIDVLVMSQYFALVDATPWYWWNIIILILGMLLCVGKLAR